MSRWRWCSSRRRWLFRVAPLLAVLAVGSMAMPSTSNAGRLPSIEQLRAAWGEVKVLWEENAEYRRGLSKAVRKVSTKALGDYRKSKGTSCPWRAVAPTWCAQVTAIVHPNSVLSGGAAPLYIGNAQVSVVKRGTIVNVACRHGLLEVRVLWPTDKIPSATMFAWDLHTLGGGVLWTSSIRSC
jgi:hypothetical protein